MIKPVLKGEAFLKNVQASARMQDRLAIWWLGQSGFLIQWNGSCLLMDPYLSDSLTRKYAGTDRPHVRMTEKVVEPEALDFIEVVTSSHSHTDHLDAETLRPLIGINADITLVIPEANREIVAERLGCVADFPVGLDADQSVALGEFVVTAIPAAHESFLIDAAGRHQALGYVVEVGPWTLYHSGDTVVYEGLEERLSSLSIDIAILPINGRDPDRGVPGNMTGEEAARLAHNIDARLVIPCHFEMFEFNTASPEPFAEECERLTQPFVTLKCGERWTDLELDRIDNALEDEYGLEFEDDYGKSRTGRDQFEE